VHLVGIIYSKVPWLFARGIKRPKSVGGEVNHSTICLYFVHRETTLLSVLYLTLGKTRLHVPHCACNVCLCIYYAVPNIMMILMYLNNYDIAIVAGVAQSEHWPAVGWTTSWWGFKSDGRKYSLIRLKWRRFTPHLAYSVRYSVVPINSSFSHSPFRAL
jgi:hypothetical protein